MSTMHVHRLAEISDWATHPPDLSPRPRLAVIGDPISHSKSPQMHNPALRAIATDASYIRVQVPVGAVAESLHLLREAGFWGVNVTIPHKFEALAAVDVLDPLAEVLGAVNTVAIRSDGLHGYNTDGPGFLRAVEEGFSCSAAHQRVLILGAGGGAGRAVAVQCALVGAPRILLANRTPGKATALRSEIQALPGMQSDIRLVEWNDEALRGVLAEVDLIVNASPLGMKDGDSTLVPADAITPRHLLFDMVYRAGGAKTSLGQTAEKTGAAYVDGSLLLLHQGAISFEHWFSQPAPLALMRAGLMDAIR
jgi:shikimate dehydrogenase